MTKEENRYPPCDYCGVDVDYMPWHGSGLYNGEISRHIHACNDCKHLLPNSGGNYILGLQLALKHCTNYNDRMFLQFLIKVYERNDK